VVYVASIVISMFNVLWSVAPFCRSWRRLVRVQRRD